MKRAVLAVVLSLTLSGAVRAQDSAEDARKAAALDEARQHVARAKVHYDLGEFKEAADEYITVYRLRPIPAILFNVAQAYRQGGLYEKARQFYKSYLRESPDAKNRAMIEQAIKDMDELLAKEKRTKDQAPMGVKEPAEATLPIKTPPAQVAMPTPPPAKEPVKTAPPAQVATNPRATTPTKPDAPPPQRRAAAAAPAESSSSTLVVLAPARVEPALSAGRPAAPFRAASTPPAPDRGRTWTWVAAGASALALGGGAAFGYKAINGAAPSDAHTANLLYGAGAVLGIATAALFIFEF